MEERERTMAAHRLKTIIQNVALDRIEDPSIGPDFDDAVEDVRLRKRAPFTVALDLLEGSVQPQEPKGAAWKPHTPGLTARNLLT
jgi:hypothetical protein